MNMLKRGSPSKSRMSVIESVGNGPEMRDHIQDLVRQQLIDRQQATEFSMTTPAGGFPNHASRMDHEDSKSRTFANKLAQHKSGASIGNWDNRSVKSNVTNKTKYTTKSKYAT